MKRIGLINSGLWVYTPRRETPSDFMAYRAFFYSSEIFSLALQIGIWSIKNYKIFAALLPDSRNQNAGHH